MIVFWLKFLFLYERSTVSVKRLRIYRYNLDRKNMDDRK